MSAQPIFAVMTRYEGERQEWADWLRFEVGQSAPAVLAVDPGGEIGPEGTWRAAREGWLCWHNGMVDLYEEAQTASHIVVLQDDVLPCDDFVPRVKAALDEEPWAVVTFFSRNRKVQESAVRGKRWATIPASQFLMAQAVAIPLEWVQGFVDFADYCDPVLGDDARIKRWCREARRPIMATVPSLVEHAEVASCIKGRSTRRQARLFAGRSRPFPDRPVYSHTFVAEEG